MASIAIVRALNVRWIFSDDWIVIVAIETSAGYFAMVNDDKGNPHIGRVTCATFIR